MKSFSQLVEANKNTVVVAFGRLNPITSGHQKLIKKVQDTASRNNADHYVYVSRTQDKKKNPLTVDQKVKYAKHSFPQVNVIGADNKVRTPIEALKFLDPKYDNVIFIAGSDRVADFQKLFDTYNGKEYNYTSIKVVSAGDRDPDADDVSGMSASKMRQMAIDNNFDQFKTGVPSTMNDQVAKQMFDDVRSGLKVREGYADERREKYINEEIFRVGDIVEYEDQEFAITYRGSNYVLLEGNKRVWLTDIIETDMTNLEIVNNLNEKLQIARIIGESFGCTLDKNDPVAIINSCLLKAKDMPLSEVQLESLDNMLVIADEIGIPFDKTLAGMVEGEKEDDEEDEDLMYDQDDDDKEHLRRRKINYKIHEDEDELSDEELDKIMSELSDDDYIEGCYEDDEFELIDEETGEVLEEDYDFSELNEVLSRVERIRARVRMKRTKSKRQRAAKIALKRRSNTQTLTKRARKMAIKALKQRFSRKPINKLSVGEKERLEKRVQTMKSTVTRLATRMVPKVRQIEKGRFDAKAQQGRK